MEFQDVQISDGAFWRDGTGNRYFNSTSSLVISQVSPHWVNVIFGSSSWLKQTLVSVWAKLLFLQENKKETKPLPCFPSDNKYLLFSTKTTFSDNIKYICVSTGYIMKSEHVPRLSGESSSPSEEENGYNKDTARTVFCHLTCHYSIRARDQGGAGENQRTPGAEE